MTKVLPKTAKRKRRQLGLMEKRESKRRKKSPVRRYVVLIAEE